MSKKLLTIGGVGQVKGRIKGMGPVVLPIRDELDGQMRAADWLARAPFESISIVLRYSESSSDEVIIERVNKHRELPLAINVSMEQLKATGGNPDKLKAIVKPAINRCLGAVQKEYGLPDLSA
ncbi:Imm39 family immunity protein [Marinobacter nauticus]|uniref:Imm39 family immunity protein n=1 Tax=Marinobacter nauticus TaxID=2743 RepID=UPI003735DE91|nr:Imm39 family immunity protein [Pseudomonadales bacterium]